MLIFKDDLKVTENLEKKLSSLANITKNLYKKT